MEKWVNVTEKIQVSDTGLVRCSKTHNYKKIFLNEKGYCCVYIMIDGKRRKCKVHRLVMQAFVGESKLTVDHIDEDKSNNNLSNLEYVSNSENVKRFFKRNDNTYKMISFDKERGKYRVRISINGKRKCLGRYDTPEEAIEVYNKHRYS